MDLIWQLGHSKLPPVHSVGLIRSLSELLWTVDSMQVVIKMALMNMTRKISEKVLLWCLQIVGKDVIKDTYL